MADLRISELPVLLATDAEANDDLAVADYSASETRRLTIKGAVQQGVTALIDDGVIPGAKLAADSVTATQIAADAITASELADDAVDTAAIVDSAVTNAKLATGIDGAKLVADSVTAAQIAANAITASELADASVDTAAVVDGAITNVKLASGIDGAKLVNDSVTATQIAANAITASELADNSVDTAAIVDGAVTNAKLATGIDGAKLTDDTVTNAKLATGIDGAKLASGSVADGAIAAGINGAKLTNSTVTDAKLAAGINGAKLTDGSVNAAKLGTVTDRGLDQVGGNIGHTNTVTPGTRSGITFDAQGHITGAAALVAADLPAATTSSIGGVSVPVDSGLTVTAFGALDHVNNVTAATVSGISYDEHGHIISAIPLAAGDIPIATETTVGGVSVPTGSALTVSAAGDIAHEDSPVAPGDYPKVTVNQKGHVTSGSGLDAGDIPGLDANKITTGTFNPARIADGSIEKEKLANYSTVIIQEADPGNGNYTGQFWYKESDAQLRTWSGNSWIPVGFGHLSEENLRFCGTFDAATGNVLQITPFGAAAGLTPGSAIPTATDPLTGVYLVCDNPGTYGGDTYDEGDWVLCLGQAQGWARIDTLSGGGSTVSLFDLLDTTITTPASGDTLIFDGGTNKWVNKPTAATKATFVESLDGTRTSFTLSADANSVNNLLISLGGIIQEQGVDFTFAAPRTVNFAGAPPAGIDYWVLIEGVASTGGGGGGGTTLPPGTAAEEYLQWNATLGSWQPSTVLSGGSY